MKYQTTMRYNEPSYSPDYSSLTMENLKCREKEIIEKLFELRKEEPSDKHIDKKRTWFCRTHFYLDDLAAVRDEISKRQSYCNSAEL